MVKCSLKFCLRNASTDMGVSFFRFPAESARCDDWMRTLGRPDLLGIDAEKLHQSKYRVCGVHFHNSSFSSMLLNRLKKDAIPVNFPVQARPGPFFEGDASELEKMMTSSREVKKVDGVENQEKEATNAIASENEESRNSTDEKEGHKTNTKENSEEADKSTEENSTTDSVNIEKTENEETESKGTESSEPKSNSESTEIERREKDGNLENRKGNEKTEIVQNGVSEETAKEDDKTMETDENEEDDDDFNPLLLCPDISMDVDESPVLTGSTELSHSNDTTDPNSLFAPLFSTFVDEMTGAEISFNLTAEEQQLRERLYGPNNPIQFTKIHCTACNVHLGSALAGQTNRFVHPLLKVLICKECYHFYTSGEFEKDEDGSELYCRWCGQGGQVLCCTMCEFVFCKKCIRINFGRKKLTQVRDSDEWKCFRCDMSQLKALRAMCVEFFEYVRKETARASTYTDTDIVNKDLTNCCQAQNRKRQMEAENGGATEKEVVRRPKRRRQEEDDPDYSPYSQQQEERSNSPVASTSGVKVVVNVPKSLPALQAKAAAPRNEVSFIGQSPSSTVRIGNTVINVKSTGTPGQMANVPSPSAPRNTAIRNSFPTIRPKPTFTPRTPTQSAVRSQVAPSPAPAVGSLAHIRAATAKPQTSAHAQPVMKHEWFEKTVRAAARVNSNLSYTLTQLNKAQSSASSVEQLAVVHNKLQEILSSSINSLIQIRKNLRTEFIAGIKTFRFPPKPQAAAHDPSDDDVIIVNPEPTNKAAANARARNSLGKGVTVRSVPTNSNSSAAAAPNKGYLKVRSFQQLQNVSSECITIPDDDPPPPPLVSIEPIAIEINEEATTPEPSDDATDKRDSDVAESEKDGEKSENKEKDGGEKKAEEGSKNKEKEESKNKEKEEIENKEKDVSKNKDKDESKNKDKDKSKNEDKDEGKTKEQDATQNKEKDETANKAEGKSAIKDNSPKTYGKKEDPNNKKSAQNGDKTEKLKEAESKTRKKLVGETNGSDSNGSVKCNGDVSESEVRVKTEPEERSYNVKDQPTPKIRRMLSVKVNLKKTTIVEDLVKKEPVESGGDN